MQNSAGLYNELKNTRLFEGFLYVEDGGEVSFHGSFMLLIRCRLLTFLDAMPMTKEDGSLIATKTPV